MRTLTEFNRGRVGMMGAVVTVLVVGVAQSFTSVPMLFATPTYYAQFADTGGINTGDKVEIAGVNVGLVRSLAIRGNRVLIGFSLPGKTIGMQSRAAIRTDTILGRKNLEIEPRGSEPLKPNGFLPLAQTTTPYQIYDAFVDVTKAATGWDIDAVKRSLNVLSETFDQTAPHLSAALEGVKAFSDTVGRRGEQIEQLLANANRIARVLGDRSEQVNGLLVNAKTLLAAFKQRSQALRILLTNVSEASAQVSGLITDNPNLNHVLAQLRTVSEELVKRKNELADVAVLLGRYTAALTEAVGSGPFFKAMVVNLLPYQILQPWVDAAFKSGASTRRTSGAVRVCRNSAGPTPTAPGSPTARRRRHRCGRVHPSIRDRPSRRERRAPTHRRRARCHGPTPHYPARAPPLARSVDPTSRHRSMSSRRRLIPMGRRRRRAS